MPDISMCEGTGCPKRNECYRHRATPSPHWQSFFMNAPWSEAKESCDYFWPIEGHGNLREPTDV